MKKLMYLFVIAFITGITLSSCGGEKAADDEGGDKDKDKKEVKDVEEPDVDEPDFSCDEIIASYEAAIAEGNAIADDATEDDKRALLSKFQSIASEINYWEPDMDDACIEKIEALDAQFVELSESGKLD